MHLSKYGPNETVLSLRGEGVTILFSYHVPVAAQLPDGSYVRTKAKWSMTTTRHVNRWLEGKKAWEVEQHFMDNLLEAKPILNAGLNDTMRDVLENGL